MENNKSVTAVEWLEQRLFDNLGKFTKGDIDQAKEMEKEQIIEANNRGWKVARENIFEPAEQYYNETFKSE